MKKKVSKFSKIDRVLELEKKQIRQLKKERKEIDELEQESHTVLSLEKKQLKELEELKNLEMKIREEVGEHPLRKISYKDIGKSTIGAFVGIVSHFTVLEGLHFAEEVSLFRANSFYLISLLVGFIMIYYTGFRKVKDVRLFAVLPLRLLLIYSVTIIVILVALYVFNPNHFAGELVYRQVAVLSLPGMIGACAADLIGGE